MLLLDAGDLLFPDSITPEETAQREVKAELILQANVAMGVDAAAVGDQDLALGVHWLAEEAKKTGYPFLSANLLTSDGKPVFPGHVTKTVCGTKVGIFSVMTPTGLDGKPVLGNDPGYRIDDPIETAKKEIAGLQLDGAQVIVAVTHLGLTEDLQLADAAPGIAMIFGGHSESPLAEPQKKGSTWIFQTGQKGKQLGLLTLDLAGPLPQAITSVKDASDASRAQLRIQTYQDRIAEVKQQLAAATEDDRKQILNDQIAFYQEQIDLESKALPKPGEAGSTLNNELIELNRDVPDEPKVEALVDAAKAKMADLPAVSVDAGEIGTIAGNGPWAGVVVCKSCHVPEFTSWSKTAHAHAFQSLVGDGRQVDFDCVGCHTTGYKQTGGPQDPFNTAGYGAVQCEACHGAGRAHAADPKNVKLTTTFDEKFCRTCHSIEQTGDRFVWSEYFPKIEHGVVKAAP